MHRIFIFVLWVAAGVTSLESSIGFKEEPASSIVNLGDRVRLRCSPDTGSEVTWYFNDVALTSSSDGDGGPQRRKRNREDRLSLNSYTVQSDSSDFDVESVLASRRYSTWRNDADRFPNQRKSRRRKDRTRKNKRRKGDFSTLPTVKRYVRSSGVDETLDAESYGIQIRPDRLTIASVTKANSGRYHCVATIAGGVIRSKTAKVEIAEMYNFTYLPPESAPAFEGEAVVVPCQLPKSVPAAQPRWKLNDATWIEESSGSYHLLRSGSLLIRNTTGLSGASFQCAAYNPVTKEIKMAPGPTELTIQDSVGEILPRIIYPMNELTEVMAKVGEQVLLECITNVPTALAWEEEERLPTAAIRTPDGLSFQATASDSGSYACSLPDLSMKRTYKLDVIGDPEVFRLSSAVISERDSESGEAVFECDSKPSAGLKWSWYYNAELVVGATDNTLRLGHGVELTDGLCQCFAENQERTGYAIFQVTGIKAWSPVVTTSDVYFNASLDEDGIERPTITGRTEKPTSYELTWSSNNVNGKIKLYSIKYYKTPIFAENGSTIRYESRIVNVPGNLNEVVLNHLQPASTYVLEMVAVDVKGSRSQLLISSFRTGEEKDDQPVGGATNGPANRVPSPERPRSPIKPNTDRNRLKVPKAPSRPTVTKISAHKISLMWRARGNGGSPIQGYRIQSKRVDEKEGWKIIIKFISATDYPPYEITDIERGAVYKFRVIAVNTAGDSKASPASESHPKEFTREPERLQEPPHIDETITQGDTDIVITWKYDVPASSIGGYYVYYRPSDSDDEDDYTQERVSDPSVTSYVIYHLKPGMQYDIKIRAYNSLGQSPFSNVMIVEMPKQGTWGDDTVHHRPEPDRPDVDVMIPRTPDYNEHARQRSYQRNTMFLITGAVIGVVLIVLLITVFCYWRKKGTQTSSPTSPNMKQRNEYIAGKPAEHMNMTPLNANGRRTPNSSASHTPSQYKPSPHDTRCQCSRHHSNHSSLGRDGMDYPAYPMPSYNGQPVHPGYQEYPGPGNYPRIYSNPMRMYMDGRHPYFSHGRGMAVPGGPPIWWVRGDNGEFCHIVPSDARKMSGAGEDPTDAPGTYPGGGGAMMMRTYDGNVTSGFFDDNVHRPDHGYHSNEDGTRTSSDSQAERSDELPLQQDGENNSLGGATSGVVTLNDCAIESRPSSKLSSGKGSESEPVSGEDKTRGSMDSRLSGVGEGSGSDAIDDVTEDTPLTHAIKDDAVTSCDHLDENTIFLHKLGDERNETLIA